MLTVSDGTFGDEESKAGRQRLVSLSIFVNTVTSMITCTDIFFTVIQASVEDAMFSTFLCV